MKKITLLILTFFISFLSYSQMALEGFESTTGPDLAAPTTPSPWTLGTGVWSVFDNGVGLAQRWGINSNITTPVTVYAGTNAAYINRENVGGGNTSEDYLATPLVTIPTGGQLRFWTRSTISGDQGTVYQIKINTTNGTQNTVANYTLVQQWTEATLNTTYNIYEEKVVDLSAYAGQQVYVAFVMKYAQPAGQSGIGGDRWLVDNAQIVLQCAVPTALAATPAATTANLSWTSTATSWEVEVVPTGTTPTGTGTVYNGTLPYPATGLTANTSYDYYVRALCGGGINSAWVGPFPFTTTIAPIGCGGNYVDSGGATASYSNNENTSTLICPSNATDLVTVTFTLFDTESCCDHLSIYDGSNASAPLIGTYQGTTLPPAATSSVPGGCLYFVFTSDISVTHAGWVANISCTPAPACSKPITLVTSAVLATTATVSWTQPINPDNSTASAWEYLLVPCGGAVPTAATPATGTATNPLNLTGLSPTTCYTIYSRAVCSSTNSSAWSTGVNFTTQALPPVCGGNYVDSGGTTANYSNSENTTTTICPVNATDLVTVTFTAFDTETNFDKLLVYDGNSSAGTLLATYTGLLTGAALPTVVSSVPGGCLTFVFTSDGSVTHAGWVANVTCAPAPTCSKPTNVVSSAATGTTLSYSWTQPLNPDNSTATSWKVLLLPCGSATPTASTPGWVTVTTNSYTATGLTLATCYDFYVMATCSTTDSSPIKGLLTTSTTCGSQAASSTCDVAPPICLLQPYCGNTSATYAPPHTWTALTDAFSTCLGGASIENNSFINFEATSTTASFNIFVYNSLNNNGVQFFAFDATCGGAVTPKGCALVAPTGQVTPVSFTMTGLTPGNIYHLMFDGYAGDVCDYQVVPINGVATSVAITPSAPSICAGQSVLLTASGGNNTYTWSPSTGLNATTGTSVTATPTATTTYTVTTNSTSTTLCPLTKTVTIVVNPLVTPVTGFSYTTPVCSNTANQLPTTATGFTTGGTFSSTAGLSINSSTGEINVASSTPGPYTITYTVLADPANCKAASSSTATITVKPLIIPTFIEPAPICSGTTAPVLPSASSNTPPITGTWSPSTVSNTASADYTFTPDSGQCASTTTLHVTVNTNCTFGSFANAVWLTNCTTSNFFNTVGSGTSIIGPVANVFPNSNLGTYLQNSNTLILRGGEVKTFKSATANVCGANLYYRIYPQASAPGTFSSISLAFFSDCGNSTAGQFDVGGGPCNPRDQKWQKVLPNALYPTEFPVDLTTYSPGNYVLEVYYDISGSSTTTTGCTETVLINNGGANFIANYTIQAQPVYTFNNPTTCNGTDGSIKISGLAPNAVYTLTYNDDSTVVGPLSSTSNTNGEIVISGLNAGTYSNFLLVINGCSYSNTNPITLTDPPLPTVTVNSPTVCQGATATVTATPGDTTATYTYAWTVPAGVTTPVNTVSSFTTTVAGTYSVIITNTTTNCVSATASGTVTMSSQITPTFATIAPICQGGTIPVLQTTSINGITGTWSPATISNTTGTNSYTFTPNSSQPCAQSISINVTINPLPPAPTVSILTQPTCTTGGSVQVTSPLNSVSTLPTDLFISEVTDAETGALTYIELFNGTGSAKNLSNYKIKVYNNGNTTTSCDLSLTGIIANNTTNVIKVSSDANQGGVIPNQIFNTCGGVNINDNIKLTSSSDVVIDNWGPSDGSTFTPAGQPGYDYRRHANAVPLPSTAWNPADWDTFDPEVYTNVGQFTPFTNNQYSYNIDGGTYQSNTTFTGLPSGNHTITVQDINTGCISLGTTINLNNPPSTITPVTGFSYTTPVCANGTNPTPTTVAGFTSGGTYSSTAGLSINSTTGVINLATSTPNTYTITYSIPANAAACQIAGSSTTTITINAVVTPVTGFSYTSPVCANGTNPTPTPVAGFTSGGTYSSTAGLSINSATGVINLATSTPNTYTVTYSIPANVAACQVASSSTATITINAVFTPVTGFSYTTPVCANGINPTPTTVAGFTSGGTYSSTAGLSINSATGVIDLTTSTPNSYTVTYSIPANAAACQVASSSTTTITINAVVTPVTGFSYTTPVCANGTNPIPTTVAGFTSGGAYSSTAGLSINSATGVIDLTTSTPNSYTVTYSIPANAAACQVASSSTTTITINAVVTPVTGFSYTTPVCANGTNPIPTTVAGFTSGGTYSSTAGLSINSTTGVINLATSTPNTYTVTYSVLSNAATCQVAGSSTTTITINALTTPTFASFAPICPGDPVPTLSTSSTNATPITGTWFPATVSNTATGTYTFTPNVGQCASQTTVSVTVSNGIDFAFDSGCNNNEFIVTTTPINNSYDPNTVHYNWTLGTSNAGHDAQLNVTNYLSSLPNPPALPLTFSLNISNPSGCNISHSILVDRIYCEIQKGISPNGDGKNDYFDLRLLGVSKLEIFNRYGMKVYDKTNYSNEWQGQDTKGDILPDGTYYYVIEFKSGFETKTGWIYINTDNK